MLWKSSVLWTQLAPEKLLFVSPFSTVGDTALGIQGRFFCSQACFNSGRTLHKKARKEEEESKPREDLGVETEQEDGERMMRRREFVRGLRLWREGLDVST